MTIPRPSNFPAVYMLDCPISCSPFLTYQICKLPPPRSDPVARKSTSSFHAACSNTLSVHIDPLWFAPYGCVRMTLFERHSGVWGTPARCQPGMCPGVSVILRLSMLENEAYNWKSQLTFPDRDRNYVVRWCMQLVPSQRRAMRWVSGNAWWRRNVVLVQVHNPQKQ